MAFHLSPPCPAAVLEDATAASIFAAAFVEEMSREPSRREGRMTETPPGASLVSMLAPPPCGWRRAVGTRDPYKYHRGMPRGVKKPALPVDSYLPPAVVGSKEDEEAATR